MTACAARMRSSRCPARPRERQKRTTVASEVPAAWASSVMVRVEAASGSRMISWATFVSAFESEGRTDLMSTRRLGVSVRLAGMTTRYTRRRPRTVRRDFSLKSGMLKFYFIALRSQL
jgi:hypothetical protein